MNDTIYWAVKLSPASKNTLLNKYPPKHPNVFAEHMTIIFKPSDQEDEKMVGYIGHKVLLTVGGYAADDKGQAVVADGFDILDGGNKITHITISYANGTKPVYSNTLLQKGYNQITPFILTGTVSKFTKIGWKII